MIISDTLSKLKIKCALIPFIPAGIPSLEFTKDILLTFDHAGADVIELGLPYSDPLADGPIIQNACWKALKQGINLVQILKLVKEVSPYLKAPILLFAYYNSILSQGILNFVEAIYIAGVKGLAIPDLPLEEADYIIQVCSKFCIELVLFITPTSSSTKINTILAKSPGTIYIISSIGVTGIRSNLSSDLHDFIDNIRKITNKPLILGFGISKLSHVQEISTWNIDGIVMGSAFVSMLSIQSNNKNMMLKDMQNFCISVMNILNKICK
jgi:tryptophan synthase alpha chain|uniref:Tryptophan synthase alpha chain n=1 Tax=Thorea hispida TaxID=202687 RepID=A0A1C9CAH0_9FLOR|nr:tRNA-Lys [Thorea hispida]AOM65381.1 tRNA-Lys [Thorea hispida]